MDDAIITIVIACAAAAVISAFFLMRRKAVKMVSSIEDALDSMLDGSFRSSGALYADTLTARVSAKIKRLCEIMQNQSELSSEQHSKIQRLVSDISHQSKTPIANIKMLNETGIAPQKRAEMQQQLDAQVDKLDFLIQALVKSSRLETGVVEISPSRAAVFDTLAQAVGGIALAAEKKGIGIAIVCSQDIFAWHDKKWTSEALSNILDNAVKYTPRGGWINVACEQWEIFTRIDISDNGMGIAEAELAQVFARFYRSPSVRQYGGIGIGLYLSRKIIEKQGGYISAASSPGEGSTFSVYIPNNGEAPRGKPL